MEQNQRRYPRKFLPPVSPEQLAGLSYVANISLGGAFIKTNHLREVGTKLGITIKLPLKKSPPIRANGIVRWVVHYGEDSPWKGGMGIEFKEISPKSIRWIQRYIQRLERPQRRKRAKREVQVKLLCQSYETPPLPALLEGSGLFVQWNPLDLPPELHRAFSEEPEVGIELYLGEEKCSLKGKILWSNKNIPESVREIIPSGIAVRFFRPSEEVRRKILTFLRQNTS